MRMSLKKRYLKKTAVCKVAFSLAKQAVGSATNVHLAGNFNDWNQSTTPLKRLKNGAFTATLALQPNKECHFRYLIDGLRWENNWYADNYVPNGCGRDDSVVVV